MAGTLDDIEAFVAARFGSAVSAPARGWGELAFTVDRAAILDVLRALRDDPAMRFVSFIDLCGVDYPSRELRFDVVYHLLSPTRNARIRLKVETDETTPVPSCVDVYPGALWFEREAYDLFGILFTGHPDMRRILTDYGFDGYPMRKDFPLTGYVEVRYDENAKRVVYEPVRLTQEFRNFDFLSPWEGTDYALPGDEKASPKTNWSGNQP